MHPPYFSGSTRKNYRTAVFLTMPNNADGQMLLRLAQERGIAVGQKRRVEITAENSGH
jgi:hypothetical protein